jgi:hypothetical protein
VKGCLVAEYFNEYRRKLIHVNVTCDSATPEPEFSSGFIIVNAAFAVIDIPVPCGPKWASDYFCHE